MTTPTDDQATEEETTYARVRIPSIVYRRLKAAAALRDMPVGDLIRQMLGEHVEDYLNLGEKNPPEPGDFCMAHEFVKCACRDCVSKP